MTNRVAIVTGGSGGIGGAVARAFAAAGAAVAVVGRSEERVVATERDLARLAEGPGLALGLALDVRREDDMRQMAEASVDRFGRIDVLVTCAGVDARDVSGRAVPDAVATMSEATWRTVLDTNLRGTFLAARAVLPTMFAQSRGDILTVSSEPGGLRGQPLAAAYCASKFAVGGVSEALADEVRGKGVRVQMLVPGLVDTPLVRTSTLDARLGPALDPERVGQVALALATLPDDVTVTPARRHGVPVVRHARAADGATEQRRPRVRTKAQVPV